jgi:hypothetical protein
MRYWGLLAAKFAAIGIFMLSVYAVLKAFWPMSDTVSRYGLAPFARDLGYTSVLMLLWLVGVGLAYLAILDQRYRCRTCLRRLRMPLTSGGWNGILLGPPRTDYICPFGHGTLRVPDLHISSGGDAEWDPIDDMWRELEELHSSRK